jgi:osmotically-inducible protein OsmY
MNVLIAATEGRITLSGVLEPGLDERDAVEVAQRVSGVSEVESTLRVTAASRYKMDS